MANANQNFRITTDYILELFDVSTNNYFKIWIAGNDGSAALKIDSIADTTSVALNITTKAIPNGNENSNYRVVSSLLQIYNVDTAKWHTIFTVESEDRTAFAIIPTGEE